MVREIFSARDVTIRLAFCTGECLKLMENQEEKSNDQPDKNEAARERPVPSQAEGDLETIEEDLRQKERQKTEKPASSDKR